MGNDVTDSIEKQDDGALFLLTCLALPSDAALEALPLETQQRVRENVNRARSLYRSMTLPLPGYEERLLNPPGHQLLVKIDSLITDGIEPRMLSMLSPPAVWPKQQYLGKWIYVEVVGTEEEPRFVSRSARQLLGVHWYRHRDMDIVDVIEMWRDKKRDRPPDDLLGPLPPRRLAEEH